jgi:hypothetical protein
MTEGRRPPPKPVLLDPAAKKRRQRTLKAPRRHERDVASGLDGLVQPASGALPGAKGDVRGVGADAYDFLVECKETAAESIRVSIRWLNKVTTEAGVFKYPALAFRFDAGTVQQVAKRQWEEGISKVEATEADWIAVPLPVFRRMLESMGRNWSMEWRGDREP